MIIAIDGPAASGKSTIARLVAKKMGYDYLDTGAMYRALTWKALSEKVDFSDEKQLANIAKKFKIFFETDPKTLKKKVIVEDKDITKEIRSTKVSSLVSIVSKVPAIRQMLVGEQRAFAKKGNVVVEGRDIGTVVFPQAEVKIFLTATPAERAKRRQQEFLKKGIKIDKTALERKIVERDHIDSTRQSSPLVKAQDAHLVNTDNKTVREVAREVLKYCLKELKER
ncbi:MAG: (d)CMP kinase [Actinobacteria bacterium]|nr:(d)CMP kinase [Actinomycetota bacterium]